SIVYGDQGVRVSVLCPQAVRTAMLDGRDEGVASLDGVLEPEQVADNVIEAMEREEFFILPHPKVQDYVERKATDHGRWLRGMRKLRAAHGGAP
ncbi:MAG: short-chain dehydrogenase, partial [Rhodospirillales bacterium]|nr:short-chain dehydrogenase [Rhodospirillales bacterium]